MTASIPGYYFNTMKGRLRRIVLTEDPYRLFRYVSLVFLLGIVAGSLMLEGKQYVSTMDLEDSGILGNNEINK
ncbi:MAG: hypothetical protein DRP59_11610 [Spirochaetes bacterium]|nr:MAG: hypothetical protein DRP59_11610 [Spirochaetota bacterium]